MTSREMLCQTVVSDCANSGFVDGPFGHCDMVTFYRMEWPTVPENQVRVIVAETLAAKRKGYF
jgi:hypothetical protein